MTPNRLLGELVRSPWSLQGYRIYFATDRFSGLKHSRKNAACESAFNRRGIEGRRATDCVLLPTSIRAPYFLLRPSSTPLPSSAIGQRRRRRLPRAQSRDSARPRLRQEKGGSPQSPAMDTAPSSSVSKSSNASLISCFCSLDISGRLCVRRLAAAEVPYMVVVVRRVSIRQSSQSKETIPTTPSMAGTDEDSSPIRKPISHHDSPTFLLFTAAEMSHFVFPAPRARANSRKPSSIICLS
ncbi:hypothetical protein BDZ89DRAFT_636460 [Hymenopellis radicata]|nr:hypothetical protein BDZ89DRAFT_636460 [Hymenopellis radicata]